MQALLSFLYESWAIIIAIFGVVEIIQMILKLKFSRVVSIIFIAIIVLSAYVGNTFIRVPNVEGLANSFALLSLRDAGLNACFVQGSSWDDDNTVSYQSIVAGSVVKKGETVLLSYDKQPGIYEEAKYEMEVYVTQENNEPYRRNFRDYSVQGTNEVYSTRDTYGEKYITFTVTENQLAQAAVYSPGATIPEDNSGMFVGGINKSNKDAYVMQIPLYDGRYYPLFIKTKIG